ncbi:hypothetical protein PTSG_12400 [Salpingoeca rosetta]|uniref:Uncharacterized protein n=1 Tax=Salpingoeca rosetta (strain ATCC 50818 / BSB-021) TaxID=946362 RepID=F2UC20_SALR5|nr:uncharacterized protein PTSG_12400 [Salpingoeca rosetta]EGD74127.1 hypothetical protein PTSG_12400 [Salpingoeca rosetta]|eukprot:XP_004993028.1 hypothetical protein PTSG_12400 [Salpingoeca rosetta]
MDAGSARRHGRTLHAEKSKRRQDKAPSQTDLIVHEGFYNAFPDDFDDDDLN